MGTGPGCVCTWRLVKCLGATRTQVAQVKGARLPRAGAGVHCACKSMHHASNVCLLVPECTADGGQPGEPWRLTFKPWANSTVTTITPASSAILHALLLPNDTGSSGSNYAARGAAAHRRAMTGKGRGLLCRCGRCCGVPLKQRHRCDEWTVLCWEDAIACRFFQDDTIAVGESSRFAGRCTSCLGWTGCTVRRTMKGPNLEPCCCLDTIPPTMCDTPYSSTRTRMCTCTASKSRQWCAAHPLQTALTQLHGLTAY